MSVCYCRKMSNVTDREETIDRAKLEIMRLTQEIRNCAHCASLRNQIVRLQDCLPPEPLVASNGARLEYIGPLAPLPKDLLDRIAAATLSVCEAFQSNDLPRAPKDGSEGEEP